MNYLIFICCLCTVHALSHTGQSDLSCHDDNCVTMPENCAHVGSTTQCLAMFTFNVTEHDTQLRLTGHIDTNQYVAVGLSEDVLMGDDLVMDCYAGESSTVDAQFSFNKRRGVNEILSNQSLPGIHLEGSTRMNGQVMCQWLWTDEVIVNDQNFEKSSTDFHILLAVGSFKKNGQGM